MSMSLTKSSGGTGPKPSSSPSESIIRRICSSLTRPRRRLANRDMFSEIKYFIGVGGQGAGFGVKGQGAGGQVTGGLGVGGQGAEVTEGKLGNRAGGQGEGGQGAG